MSGTIISCLANDATSICICDLNDLTVSTWLVCPKLESDDQSEWMVDLFILYLDKHSCSFAGTYSTSSFPEARVNICIRTLCVWVEFDFALLP